MAKGKIETEIKGKSNFKPTKGLKDIAKELKKNVKIKKVKAKINLDD